ncbi:MAG: choice-of-anchor B family protein, partial [Saprospiraceae bacterium]|nr:choice-of-anchor B family protein [Saprospiraceae bacterium]
NSARLSDIWGYVHPDGTEYALVGTYEGVSIVSLANPSDPQEVAFIDGHPSIWRDLKTWQNYMYVVADEGEDGLLVADLSYLPDSVPYHYTIPWSYYEDSLNTFQIKKAHNIWIDQQGRLYVVGWNNSPGLGYPALFDLNSDPWQPTQIRPVGMFYAHDLYARDNMLWTADIYEGHFSAYDITNINQPISLGSYPTPTNFTHNVWLSDDAETLFTTDERPESWIGAYDISDPDNFRYLDRWRPNDATQTGAIPHNVHVHNDYLLVSYYTEGLIVLDASKPDNLVKVAQYDTYPNEGTGFRGAWGAYPFLPSGLVLISDINTGLHILDVDYQRACYLEGWVYDQGSNEPIFDAKITVTDKLDASTTTDWIGNFKTGIAQAGSYKVLIEKQGYESKSLELDLENGKVKTINITLQLDLSFPITGKVLADEAQDQTIANAKIQFINSVYTFEVEADALGNFILPKVYAGEYTVNIGKWGRVTQQLKNVKVEKELRDNFVFRLPKGYRDEFLMDLGWKTQNDPGITGEWNRTTIPYMNIFGQYYQGDATGDLGDLCYLTGTPEESNVNLGKTRLKSPLFTLADYKDPYFSFQCWFVNRKTQESIDSLPLDDFLHLYLYNSTTNQLDLIATYGGEDWAYWSPIQQFSLLDYTNIPEDSLQIIFELGDDPSNPHWTSAAIDQIQITEGIAGAWETITGHAYGIRLYPNPFSEQLLLDYYKKEIPVNQEFRIYDALGRLIYTDVLKENTQVIPTEPFSQKGVYFFELEDDCIPIIKN